ncbi:Coenzyme PQQ synthesis protein B [Enhygromyxa salina]|uniref:Coenzyme PQQ synthesis protein B n=2 Tax=Enhygromyxa salina TaxID=215803 RepID=A0A2S9XQG8_9BACT|nr:Coenzyme PQQ synthesis protein B [Enhygromyxa salina]
MGGLVVGCTVTPSPRDCACEQVEPGLEPTTEPVAKPVAASDRAVPEPAQLGPRLRILGVAQDGGLPHIGCDCPRCDAARSDPGRASPVASVAVIAPQSRGVWVVDATPDLARQLDMLADVRELVVGGVDRTPLSGILLTHAHMGHYLGLAQLGYEAGSADAVPVYASARMVEFLATNAPWDQLVRLHNIEPSVAEPGGSVALGDGLTATPLLVPHRGEYTDTLGWYLAGPRKRALYIPDTDPWAKWELDIDAALDGVQLLLVDGTFHDGDELPGRDVSEIGHPLMVDTMERFADRLGPQFELWFIHLNHSNPTLDPRSPQRRELEQAGFVIAEVGREYAL